jgi:hypothetical protein
MARKLTIHFNNGEKLAFPSLEIEQADGIVDLLRTKRKSVSIGNGDGEVVVFLRAIAWVIVE